MTKTKFVEGALAVAMLLPLLPVSPAIPRKRTKT